MKKNRFRIILIVAILALMGYFLYPTWQDSQYQDELTSRRGADSAAYLDQNEESIREAREKRIKLGLDLQGGMYVTLEVNIGEMLDKIARNKDEALRQILEETTKEALTSEESVLDIFKRKFSERGLRLSRYYGELRSSNDEIIAMLQSESDKAVDRAMEIIRNRIDKYGVSEVSITRSGSRRIILELPGVSNEREVRQLIQETAQLEFKLLGDPKLVESTLNNINKLLSGYDIDKLLDTTATAIADSAKADTSKTLAANDTSKTKDSAKTPKDTALERAMKQMPFTSLLQSRQFENGAIQLLAPSLNRDKINRILARPDVRRLIPAELQFAWSAKSQPLQTQDGTTSDYYEFYALSAEPELTGDVITDARAQMSQEGFGGAIVTMEMNTEGAREWARITGENVGKQIAIALDDAVFSAPNVRQKIIGGNSMIEGMDNMDEARLLEIVLKAGALPAPVDIIEERTVGPSLGEDSIAKGLNSFIIGIGLVMLYMLFIYQFAGFTSDLAVLLNMVFILGILAAFNATLTLPGIAGMLLTVGMAVDSNVLINERIREEITAGKTLRAALEAGYARAMPSIIDSNLTTLITSIILYQLGSGPIQGFALTLMIGLLCSLYTSIVVTRVIMEVTLDTNPKLVTFG